ncbi:MAG: HAMP domain-containing protein [Deltaproteobacteria bacterium]|nr:HAMP domain-containing protein [Deltaproteobacteria bacterium]
MGLKQRILKYRRDTRLIVGGLGALFLLLGGLFYLQLYDQELPARMINNRILLFALWYINVVLILAVLLVLFRTVFKMMVERRYRLLGSKFKTKLIATYIGLSLFPVLLLFFFANQLLHGSIERWFNEPLREEVVLKARDVAVALNLRIERDNLRNAAQVLGEVSSLSSAGLIDGPQLGLRLQELLDESDVDILAVYEGTEFLRAVISPRTGLADLPELEWNLLSRAAREGKAVKITPLPGLQGRLMLAAVSYGTTDDSTSNPLVVVSGTLVDQPVAGQLADLVQLYQTHQQLRVEKDSIRASYLLIFLMATLLILLASSWVGLYLARRVTVPIQALAAGTRRIMTGDLAYRVDVDADDELGVLVESFNMMTHELEHNRKALELSNQELQETSREQAEERALIAAVLQNVAAGVISIDSEGRIFTCNGAARTMLRLRGTVLGQPTTEVFDDPKRSKLAGLLEKISPEEGRFSEQVDMVLGGEWRTFEVTLTPFRDADDAFRGHVMVLEDLSDLIKAQKLAAWNEAARRVAHEIKNPLTPIKLSAERLLRKYKADQEGFGPALEESVEIIGREVAAMQHMVDEFSRFARMPSPQPSEVDLDKLLHDTLSLYQDLKPGVEVSGKVAPEVQKIWLDGEQIKRVLINLLDNALEATESPGTVRVAAEKSNGHLRLHVSDTGSGIPDADKEKLFLPYYSTKGRGTGLGLAIVQRIVTDHHGRIRVKANQPSGTVFTLELPTS